MKCILWIVVLVLTCGFNSEAKKLIFLRFYDFSGHKFEKGQFIGTTDSSIVVQSDSTQLQIPISKIYSIKTKRSYGHNFLLSALIESVPLSIYYASTGEPRTNDNTLGGIIHDYYTVTPGEGAEIGVFIGVIGGAITGALVSGNSRTFIIDGDIEIWKRISSKIAPKGNP